MTDIKRISDALNQPLDPKHVRKPDGRYGPKGDYIEGWHAIAEANRIFGFGGWSYEPVSLDKISLELGTDNNGKPQWQAAYTCTVRVNALGVDRTDVGFGSGFAKQIGDAVEGATKEAVTDALKRALRTFGNPFGLALYDKTKANVRTPEAPPEETRDRIKTGMDQAKHQTQLRHFMDRPEVAQAKASLPEPMQMELDAHFNALWGRLPDAAYCR